MAMTKKQIRMKQLAETPKPKVKRRRKPMTEEQKKAAAERLAKARAAKKKPSSAPKNVHPSVTALPDENALSLKNVREWIKYNKDLRAEEKRAVRANVKGAEAKVASLDGYIRNMEHYIRSGDWVDNYYGKDQNNRIQRKCTAIAFHFEGPFKGMPKRDVGVLYPDVGIWTQEMNDDYYDVQPIEHKPKTRKRKKK